MKRKNPGTQESGMFDDDAYESLKQEVDMLTMQIKSLQESILFYERRLKSLEVKALGSFANNPNRASLGYLYPSIGDVTTK
jgi:predicted  nucleic acid-binding Zn-ribbon protein